MRYDIEQETFELNKAELKAIMAFASSNAPHLHAVHFDADKGAIVATDGHTLIRCDCMANGEGAFTVPLSTLKLAAKMMTCKNHVLHVALYQEDRVSVEVWDLGKAPCKRIAGWTPHTVDHFPPTWENLCDVLNNEPVACKYGINPEYLARLALVGKMGVESLRPCATGELDPVAYRGDGDGVEVLVIIMPIRI